MPESEPEPARIRYTIGAVARRTRLRPDLLRAWERRYQAVVPRRTETNRRYYSEDDIAKLKLLREAIEGGHRIAQLASLSIEQLRGIVAGDREAGGRPAVRSASPGAQLELCLQAVVRLDTDGLELELRRATAQYGHLVVIEEILVPLIEKLGASWEDTPLGIAHEHLATAVIQSFLAGLKDAYSAPPGAPRIVIATPAGQRHELGALLVAATVAAAQWKGLYLGADLPAEQIVAAAREGKAAAVALSLVFPADNPRVQEQLDAIDDALPPSMPLLLGGRAAADYAARMKGDRTTLLSSLSDLREFLDPAAPGPSRP